MPDINDPEDRWRERRYYDFDSDLHHRRRYERPPSAKGCLLQFAGIAAAFAVIAFGVNRIAESVAADEAFEESVYEHATEEWTTTDTVKLAAMSSNTSTSVSGSGGNFLGSGAFVVRTSEDQQLRYVERLDDDGYVMGSVSAESAVIYEIADGSDQEPRIETQHCRVETDDPEHQAWIDEDSERRSKCRTDDDAAVFGHQTERLRVYVPAGTVVDAFSVDAGK